MNAVPDRMDSPAGAATRATDRTASVAFWICFSIIAIWLAFAAYLVNVDLFDGYSTIANAQYYIDGSGEYFWQRGPALALLLTPAEFLAQKLNLQPLDVRPHHALMALLHGIYLVGVWKLIERHFGSTVISLTAYLAAVPTFVFFSYAPFISHDIFPGLLVLLMVTLAHAFMQLPSKRSAIALFALGASLPLIKQTYALVWVALLVASSLQALIEMQVTRQTILRLATLAAAALCGGIVCWSIYSLQLAERFPEASFLSRPIELARAVSMLYTNEGAPQDIFYQLIYFRNLPAYGLLAAVLVLPGWIIALTKRGSLLQLIALTWGLLVLALLAIPVKEVRYLAFLAPLTAALLIPALTLLWTLRSSYRYGIFALLLVDAARLIPEALRIRDHYYQDGVIGFFEPLNDARLRSGFIYFERYLSFVSPEQYAFYGDRYHRITHLDAELLSALYQIPPTRFRRLSMSVLPEVIANAHADDIFLLASSIAARVRPFRPGNAAAIDPGFVQSISSIDEVLLRRAGDQYLVTGETDAPIILAGAANGRSSLTISRRNAAIAANDPIIQSSAAAGSDSISLRGLRVASLCTLAGCQNFARVEQRRSAEPQ